MGFVKLESRPCGHRDDRPSEALNALNSQVLSDLDAVIDQVAADDEIYDDSDRRGPPCGGADIR